MCIACPAGEKLTYHYTNEEDGQQLRPYRPASINETGLHAKWR
jgi:hypothetical protein